MCACGGVQRRMYGIILQGLFFIFFSDVWIKDITARAFVLAYKHEGNVKTKSQPAGWPSRKTAEHG